MPTLGPDTVVDVTAPVIPKVTVTQPVSNYIVALVPGPQGPSGGTGFVYTQTTPAAQWTINHDLGRLPLSTLVVIGGAQVVADIIFPSASQVVITFPSPMSGTATLI
jgi:hypothetical protein